MNKVREKISKVFLIIGLCMLPVFIIAMVVLLFFNNYLPATWAPIVLFQIMLVYYCIMAIMFLLAVIFRRMSTKPVKVFFTIGIFMFLFMIFYLFLSVISPTTGPPLPQQIMSVIYLVYIPIMLSFFALAIVFKIIDKKQKLEH